MKWPPAATVAGVDPVVTSGGLGAVAGLASLGWPFFDGLTAALVALAALAWGSRHLARPLRPPARRAPDVTLLSAMALAALSAGWAFFLLAPAPWLSGRGAVLGVAGGLVAWAGRRPVPFGEMG
jgi:hypothetical protein